ncbi:alpha/beta fold hydrolase [Luteibacter flocculans]|uniref:Alpha/beta fold hydrolase n=1 Tax=Luteibacter flocculans TaxID=2780091 RepID=A0ABY4T6U8_9GAMM|nr:alpha/beta fold hydrolase [Luteibacter flocculans]URL58486.1 alpha/beta fold hydrolase [Luteibacter flocculans]
MKHPPPPRAFLALAFMCLAGIHPGAAKAANPAAPPRIIWSPCPAGFVAPVWQPIWGERMECGIMAVPLAYDGSATGQFGTALIRIKAGIPSERQGALFFNFGGPGGSPLDYLPDVAYLWSSASKDDPLDGDKRRLADHFDLIGVVPRGLRLGDRYDCASSSDTAVRSHDPTINPDDAVWEWVVRLTAAQARACPNELKPYIGSLDHVHDMEQARLSLGEPVMNFLGISYGTWVGALYAATYPQHVGRIVLDSSMNYAGTFENQLDDSARESQDLFMRRAVLPAAADPRYGLGTDSQAILQKVMRMPAHVLELWVPILRTPADLTAALIMAPWFYANPYITPEYLMYRLQGRHFSADPSISDAIRNAATQLARTAAHPAFSGRNLLSHSTYDASANEDVNSQSVYFATICGDTPWRKTLPEFRAKAESLQKDYPAAGLVSVEFGLVCHHWGTAPRFHPPLAGLADAPPFLIVNAEFDPATPLALARRAFAASPSAHMVIADGMAAHGIFGASATPCVEQSVGHFLLTGELPEERETHCAFVPRTPKARSGRTDGLDPDERREILFKRLRHS